MKALSQQRNLVSNQQSVSPNHHSQSESSSDFIPVVNSHTRVKSTPTQVVNIPEVDFESHNLWQVFSNQKKRKNGSQRQKVSFSIPSHSSTTTLDDNPRESVRTPTTGTWGGRKGPEGAQHQSQLARAQTLRDFPLPPVTLSCPASGSLVRVGKVPKGFVPSGRKALDLFSGSGSVSKRLKELGYEVVTLDINPRCRPDIVCDILKWPFRQ